jgi:hypothetical protein
MATGSVDRQAPHGGPPPASPGRGMARGPWALDTEAMSADVLDFVGHWFPCVTPTDDAETLVAPLLAFNRALDAAEQWEQDDVVVLVVEQQGVWWWGRRADGGYAERPSTDGSPWRSVELRSELFWLHHAAFEALWSSPSMRSAAGLDAVAVGRLLGVSRPLPCSPWHWPGDRTTLFTCGPALVMVCEDRGGYWVVASARTEADLGLVDGLDLVWDEADTRVAPL